MNNKRTTGLQIYGTSAMPFPAKREHMSFLPKRRVEMAFFTKSHTQHAHNKLLAGQSQQNCTRSNTNTFLGHKGCCCCQSVHYHENNTRQIHTAYRYFQQEGLPGIQTHKVNKV